jgi:hypothetical protein
MMQAKRTLLIRVFQLAKFAKEKRFFASFRMMFSITLSKAKSLNCIISEKLVLLMIIVLIMGGFTMNKAFTSDRFEGRNFSGKGDVEYLQMLDIAHRMFQPDPEFQNMPMLYMPSWNGLIEGPTWGAWWIQNSYGTTYCALPFYQEPFVTFLQNSQDLWFNQMGDGKRVGANDWIAPDGCLCDAAAPGWIVYKQGDGRIHIHDWGMEFTAAGLLMQAELLLISRDPQAITHYISMLERCANFIETRRDPSNNLFLAGPAGNLLAPSYAGWKRPDGSYEKAYLAGLSITYIAALDRLIELEKLAGNNEKVNLYSDRRETARKGLSLITTDEGYFIKSLDPDGIRHGVYGATQYGYFESSPNHDAIAFRVVDDAQAEKIYEKIASIPGLRPHDFIIPNCPSLDDMYEQPAGLWEFGRWVNGGHWSTCEGRMVMGYYRLGKYEDARRSMRQLLTFAHKFRMDNPLVDFGSDVYQPHEPINLCYDTFALAAALIRGLFEYIYRADGLTLIPHIPPGITELEQRFPIRFGSKELYLTTIGSGDVTSVFVNRKAWSSFDSKSVFLFYNDTPDTSYIVIGLGNAEIKRPESSSQHQVSTVEYPVSGTGLSDLDVRYAKLRDLHSKLTEAGLSETYEFAYAKLALYCFATIHERRKLLSEGKIQKLQEPSQAAADKCYIDTAVKLYDGLENVLKSYNESDDLQKKRIYQLWVESN